LQVAELNLDRTSVSLPIDAKIIEETVDLGQYVVAGQSAGSAYGVDVMEIEVPLEDDELKWFYVPLSIDQNGQGSNDNFTDATVKANFAGKAYSWNSKVVRTTGQIDRKSRMISVIVQVRDAVNPDSGKPPLLPGTFTEVFIEGRVLEDAFVLPRSAVHNDNNVWIADGNSLRIVTVDVARFDKEYAYVTSGISTGQEIITTPLDVVTEGMSIRAESQTAPTMQAELEDANMADPAQTLGEAL
jgi:multidrug efflux pump subunit AcrA (membrane-fusion protein)